MYALGRGRPASSSTADLGLRSVVVEVIEGKHLVNRKTLGKQSPYCTLTFDARRQRTKAIPRGGQTPRWSETFRFDCQATPKATKLEINVYCDDPKDPPLVGRGELDLANMLESARSAHDDFTIPLFDAKSRPAGQVLLHVHLTESSLEFMKRRKISASAERARGSSDLLPPSTYAPSPEDIREELNEDAERVGRWMQAVRPSSSMSNLAPEPRSPPLANPCADVQSSADVYRQVADGRGKGPSQLASPPRMPFRRISGPQRSESLPSFLPVVQAVPQQRRVPPPTEPVDVILSRQASCVSQLSISSIAPIATTLQRPLPTPSPSSGSESSSFRRTRASMPVPTASPSSPFSPQMYARFSQPVMTPPMLPDASTRPPTALPSRLSIRPYASNPDLVTALGANVSPPLPRLARPLPAVPMNAHDRAWQVGQTIPAQYQPGALPSAEWVRPWQPALPPSTSSTDLPSLPPRRIGASYGYHPR